MHCSRRLRWEISLLLRLDCLRKRHDPNVSEHFNTRPVQMPSFQLMRLRCWFHAAPPARPPGPDEATCNRDDKHNGQDGEMQGELRGEHCASRPIHSLRQVAYISSLGGRHCRGAAGQRPQVFERASKDPSVLMSIFASKNLKKMRLCFGEKKLFHDACQMVSQDVGLQGAVTGTCARQPVMCDPVRPLGNPNGSH